MVIIDSCVWIDFFGGHETDATRNLVELIRKDGPVLVADLVMYEVLRGIRVNGQFDRARHHLASFDQITISDHETAIAAASHYRHLRSLGITPRGTIDALIAARCMADGLQLLTSDRDFEPFVIHLGLQRA